MFTVNKFQFRKLKPSKLWNLTKMGERRGVCKMKQPFKYIFKSYPVTETALMKKKGVFAFLPGDLLGLLVSKFVQLRAIPGWPQYGEEPREVSVLAKGGQAH